jgi:hypothetical protein
MDADWLRRGAADFSNHERICDMKRLVPLSVAMVAMIGCSQGGSDLPSDDTPTATINTVALKITSPLK